MTAAPGAEPRPAARPYPG